LVPFKEEDFTTSVKRAGLYLTMDCVRWQTAGLGEGAVVLNVGSMAAYLR